jgi:hypothetical protein
MTVTDEPTIEGGPEARAAAYLAEVREHLSGLSDDERDDLLDDLAAHVHQVAAEDERPLAETLGPPEAFAAELMASAGLAPRDTGRRPGPVAHVRAWAEARTAGLRRHPWGRALLDFLPELRPAWWVVRGWLVVYGITLALGDGTTNSFPFPEAFNSWVLGGVLAAVGAVLSVRLARRTPRPRWLWLANGFAILTILAAAPDIGDGTTVVGYQGPDPAYVDYDPYELRHPDGEPITNIYPYGADGQPLEQVRLYDQYGRPIELGATHDRFGNPLHEPVVGADGQPLFNVYPVTPATPDPAAPTTPTTTMELPVLPPLPTTTTSTPPTTPTTAPPSSVP